METGRTVPNGSAFEVNEVRSSDWSASSAFYCFLAHLLTRRLPRSFRASVPNGTVLMETGGTVPNGSAFEVNDEHY